MSRLIRPLRADEIDVRIGTVGAKGVTLLLYKNARVDMQILDEEFGPDRWQRDHKEVKGNMFCGIGVKTKNDEWVWKWDCGTESNTEKEKGESSDSFKRAGFCWGIGRELYSSPFIFLPAATKPKTTGRGYELVNPYELQGIYVREIETEELDTKRIITKLVLYMKNSKVHDKEIWNSETRN